MVGAYIPGAYIGDVRWVIYLGAVYLGVGGRGGGEGLIYNECINRVLQYFNVMFL